MVSTMDSGSSGPGSSPAQGTIFSLHPGVKMGTGKFTAGGNPGMDQHPIQAGVEKLPKSLHATEIAGIGSGLLGH